ncbi:phage capsid scaffolding (GPO) serine peptidase family protein [Escherichia coli P0304777.8]|nr:phage capsid scaffolding (GPO) serine peptidase family protein [Escherichia coli P0304777.8]
MANEKKTSRKKFRVAVSGSTVDGREISPVHLREAAENFNPDVYAARVNVEHYLSPCPSSEFSAMGDVTALSTEDITEGPLAGRTALYAEIEPTERMKQLVADGKKIYSSMTDPVLRGPTAGWHDRHPAAWARRCFGTQRSYDFNVRGAFRHESNIESNNAGRRHPVV